MSASTWLILAIVFFTLAAAALIASVIMFFMMDIRGIIGDLTGRKAAKGIENIRTENAYANSRSQRAANRHSNPDRQFSIGTGYLKNNANLSDAHASRRLDKSGSLMRDLGGTPGKTPGGTSETLTRITINNKTGQLERKPMNTTTHQSGGNAAAPSVKYPSQDEYGQATTVLAGTADEYSQATTVLGGAANEYSQATTVLGGAANEYNQATTVLGGAANEYNQATTVLGGASNEYSQATTVLGGAANEYNQATTVLGGAANEYNQATTVLGGANVGGMPPAMQYDASKYAPRTQMKPQMPLGFKVIRRISVTHCDEVLS